MCGSSNPKGKNRKDHSSVGVDEERVQLKTCSVILKRLSNAVLKGYLELEPHAESTSRSDENVLPGNHKREKSVKSGTSINDKKKGCTIFSCHNCSYKTTFKSSLKVHVRVHIRPNPEIEKLSGPPSLYGYQFNLYSRNIVEKRKWTVEPTKEEQCRFCQYVDDSKKVASHVTTRHGELLRGLMKIDQNTPFSCYYCGYTTLKYRALKTHIKVHLGLKPMKTVKILKGKRWYCCALCDYKTWRMGCYKRHILETSKHGAEKRFQCSLCGFKSARLKHLEHHKKTHSKREAATCDICGSVLCDQNVLKWHKKRVHSDERKFTCDICSLSTKTAAGLKSHMLSAHCELRPFPCSQCAYKAKSLNTLQIHMAIHSEERPFACDECDMRFKRMFVLKCHIKSKHSDDRPFKCPHCDHKYKFRGELGQHLRTHFDERPFKCSFCTHSAKFRSLIQIHEREVHFQEKPFKCPYCTYRATRRWLIKSHKQRHHAC